LNIFGGMLGSVNKENSNSPTRLAKSAAQKSLHIYACGYGSSTYPVVGGEQNLVIKLKSTFPSTLCPSNIDTITWTGMIPEPIKGWSCGISYGTWNVWDEGNDGNSSGYSPNANLICDCRWSIFKGHAGGSGGTYQVISQDSSAIFVWAFNEFWEFAATSKWRGCTKEGAVMGDSSANFLKIYPLFTMKRNTILKTATASFVDSVRFFNRLDTIWRATGKDTIFVRRDTTYLDTSKKYYPITRYKSVVADFDSLDRLIRLNCAATPGSFIDKN
jgi:hypothetical protein